MTVAETGEMVLRARKVTPGKQWKEKTNVYMPDTASRLTYIGHGAVTSKKLVPSDEPQNLV
jgi:hypothetical protein